MYRMETPEVFLRNRCNLETNAHAVGRGGRSGSDFNSNGHGSGSGVVLILENPQGSSSLVPLLPDIHVDIHGSQRGWSCMESSQAPYVDGGGD